MLFKSLALKNFKCFEEVEVEFAPITLLTGANSSGKSSLIYSLLAMLQTEKFPFYLSPNGKYVDLGGFEEIAFQRNLAKPVEFKSVFNLYDKSKEFFFKQSSESKWLDNNKNGLPDLLSFKQKIGNSRYELNHETIDNYKFTFCTTDVEIKGIFENRKKEAYNTILKFLLFNEAFKNGRNLSKPYSKIYLKDIPFQTINELYDTLSSTLLLGSFNSGTMIGDIASNKQFVGERFNYIGSFRLPPERTYYQKAKAQEKVDVSGEGYIDQIIEWEETNPEKFAELNKIMVDLDLLQSIQSEKMKGGRFELTVKIKENSSTAALTDVGFGISQFLPVIVADLQLPDISCLALSQPEIHLHPKIQALFGNYLANQINKSPKQYIVETHSEYLLNRIRLLLVKGEIKPEDVRVYYFENDGVKSIVHNVEFTTDGQILGAPAGFFDTYGMDVMDIALNA